jgi:hypothetical protein
MVSEGDLLHRVQTGTERRRSWWLDMLASPNKLAGDYMKSHSCRLSAASEPRPSRARPREPIRLDEAALHA